MKSTKHWHCHEQQSRETTAGPRQLTYDTVLRVRRSTIVSSEQGRMLT